MGGCVSFSRRCCVNQIRLNKNNLHSILDRFILLIFQYEDKIGLIVGFGNFIWRVCFHPFFYPEPAKRFWQT